MVSYFSSTRFIPFMTGVIMSINFVLFWAIPIMGMGQLYQSVLKPFLQPIYRFLEMNKYIRLFAATFIYNQPKHADFFPLSFFLIVNCSITIPSMFYLQFTRGHLPAWAIFAYYCSWVGIGGNMMGAAYGLAHKEGHSPKMYKKGLAAIIGNLYENKLGVFFGNVPWNFTTSHIKVHHRTNGGIGDSFYLWDFDRSNIGDFMLYVHRILLHMIGYSSIRYLRAHGRNEQADLLWSGVKTYVTVGVVILVITRSFSFLFWFYIEPLMCMTYFLALINIGFHGFLEYDENGHHIQVIDATTIVDGENDLWGEDDHMAHHYQTGVYYRDLPELQKSKIPEFQKHHASVFKTLSIVELSIYIVFGLWDKLADYYVDYTGKLTRDEIMTMLKVRAQRLETTYEDYLGYLENPTMEAKKALKVFVSPKNEQASPVEEDEQ